MKLKVLLSRVVVEQQVVIVEVGSEEEFYARRQELFDLVEERERAEVTLSMIESAIIEDNWEEEAVQNCTPLVTGQIQVGEDISNTPAYVLQVI